MQGISEAYLLPVLALIIGQFPFVVLGFHSDNGSEYINRQVAQMLEKLRIEQTKSRSRRYRHRQRLKTDLAAAKAMQQAKCDLFASFAKPRRRA